VEVRVLFWAPLFAGGAIKDLPSERLFALHAEIGRMLHVLELLNVLFSTPCASPRCMPTRYANIPQGWKIITVCRTGTRHGDPVSRDWKGIGKG
jgi:hypothetical protein